MGHDQISPRQYLLWKKINDLGLAEVQVLAPERWHSERADPKYVTPVDTLYVGDINRYMMNVEPHITKFKPDWIVSMTEFWRQQSFINLQIAKIHGIKSAFFRWENLPIDDQLPEGMREIERQVLQDANLLICGNEEAKQITTPRTSVPIVKLLETGIDTDTFKPSTPLREYQDGKTNILYVGRYVQEKGIDTIVSATHNLTNTRVIFNGGKAANQSLFASENHAFESDTSPHLPNTHTTAEFHITKNCTYNQLPNLMSSASVGVIGSVDLPNWKEQCCYVIGEMLACGLPVVSTLAGSIPEIWGQCPLIRLVPQNNPEVMREAIVDQIKNPPNRSRGPEWISATYSNTRLAQKYVEALRDHS